MDRKRFVGMLLSAAMVLNSFPLSVFAAETECIHHTEHTAECGYAESGECSYVCEECHKEQASEESVIVCDCDTDTTKHAITCALYVAPENLRYHCAEKCADANVWFDVCGFDYTACTGTDMAGAYETEIGTTGTTRECYWSSDVTTGTLTISGSGSMGNYSLASRPWNSYRNDIKTVVIENSVTTIGNYAFYNYSSLTTVEYLGTTEPTAGSGVFSGIFVLVQVPADYPENSSFCGIPVTRPSATEYSVTVFASPANSGTVSGSGSYKDGESITVKAIANEGYHFVNWTEGDQVVSDTAEYTFTATTNCDLVANFEAHTTTPTYTPNAIDPTKHNVTYSCCGAVVTKVCSNFNYLISNNGATCALTCTDCTRPWVTYTIVAPACKTYGDGNSCEMTLLRDGELTEVSSCRLTYKQLVNGQWSALTAAPIDAGSYRAEYVAWDDGSDATHSDVIIYVDYTIASKSITATVKPTMPARTSATLSQLQAGR